MRAVCSLLTEADDAHWLRVFALVFRRDGLSADAERSAHLPSTRARRRALLRRARRRKSLQPGFRRVFPELARAIAAAAPAAPLQEVREAALILLYRLLFILYAEDRDLLPVRDRRYDDYGLREQGARRYRPPQGPQRHVFGHRRPLLVDHRRPLPGDRPGRPVHRPAALQWRPVRSATGRRF